MRSPRAITPNERHLVAVASVRARLGAKAYDALLHELRQERQPTLEQWRTSALIAGVRGYTAEAWYYDVWPFG